VGQVLRVAADAHPSQQRGRNRRRCASASVRQRGRVWFGARRHAAARASIAEARAVWAPPRESPGSATTASGPLRTGQQRASVSEAQVGDAATAQCCLDLRGGGRAGDVQLDAERAGPDTI